MIIKITSVNEKFYPCKCFIRKPVKLSMVYSISKTEYHAAMQKTEMDLCANGAIAKLCCRV